MATSNVREKKNKSRVDMTKGERIGNLLDALKHTENSTKKEDSTNLNQDENPTPSWLQRIGKKIKK